jgi:hypothetical protein
LAIVFQYNTEIHYQQLQEVPFIDNNVTTGAAYIFLGPYRFNLIRQEEGQQEQWQRRRQYFVEDRNTNNTSTNAVALCRLLQFTKYHVSLAGSRMSFRQPHKNCSWSLFMREPKLSSTGRGFSLFRTRGES